MEDQKKEFYRQLERIRKNNKCPHHRIGKISIVYSAEHKSWLYSCEEEPAPGMQPRADGKCFWHTHFDPSDWQ